MLGIISALLFEKNGLLNQVKLTESLQICGIEFHLGYVDNTNLVIAACGEGKVNAARCAQIMISLFKVNNIINIGVAGALNDNLKSGDVIVANSVVQHDFDMTAINVPLGLVPQGERTQEYPWGHKAHVYIPCTDHLNKTISNALAEIGISYYEGTIATGDTFISSETQKKHIIEHFGAVACDMEGAAIGHVCNAANVGFAEIRKISDNADDNAPESYFAYQNNFSIEDIVLKVIQKL